MTLVLFGWLASQRYFRDNHNTDIRRTLESENENTDWLSFGFRGHEERIEDEPVVIDEDLWIPVGKTVRDVLEDKYSNL